MQPNYCKLLIFFFNLETRLLFMEFSLITRASFWTVIPALRSVHISM